METIKMEGKLNSRKKKNKVFGKQKAKVLRIQILRSQESFGRVADVSDMETSPNIEMASNSCGVPARL